MVTITIAGGVVALDAQDADLAAGHKWRSNNTGQVMANARVDGRRTTVTLARLVLARVLGRDLRPGEAATTWNDDGRDLRRANVVLRAERRARAHRPRP